MLCTTTRRRKPFYSSNMIPSEWSPILPQSKNRVTSEHRVTHQLWERWFHFNAADAEHEVAQSAVWRTYIKRRTILPIPDPPNQERRTSLHNCDLLARFTTCSSAFEKGCRFINRYSMLAVLSHVICPHGNRHRPDEDQQHR